jgi:hypothetical protein
LNESGVALGTIKVGQSGEGYNLAFTAPDISGTLQNYEVDFSAFVTHPSGALLVDSGERVGFVWKGDKWAEILLEIQFQTDGTKLNELPEVTYEDIASGRLAEAERLASQPFPEGVKPLNNYYYDSDFTAVYPDLDPQTGYEFSLHPEEFPMRFVYFYQAEINNISVLVATLQVLNKDNTSIFIHMVESRKFINSYRDYFDKTIRLQRGPMFSMAFGGDKYDVCKNSWSEAVTQVVCPLSAPQKDRLQTATQKLVEEQSIPEEFEEVLFVLSSGRWY